MWGLGGMYCCGRKEGGKVEGLVVVFVWMSTLLLARLEFPLLDCVTI
ncbi:hypothetical protein CsSME_00031308 [Camellia sinensis var. sinensis]